MAVASITIRNLDEDVSKETASHAGGGQWPVRCGGTEVFVNPEEGGKKAEESGNSRGRGRSGGGSGRTEIFANPGSDGARTGVFGAFQGR